MIDTESVREKSAEICRIDPDPNIQNNRTRMNPRLVFSNPNDYFGWEFYHDLLMEQQEQQ